MIILGIDPGLTNTGWGVVERRGAKLACVAYGCVTTDPAEETSRRLKHVHDEIVAVIGRHEPVAMAIETLFFNANVRTAFATGQARGAALLAAAHSDLEIGEYGPSEVKLAVVGSGTADKKQVQYMVRAILGLAEEPKPDHAADALALAICHANVGGMRTASRLPRAAKGATSGWAAAVARAEKRAGAR